MYLGKKGKFITVEGLEGSGKTTVVKYIKEYCKNKKLKIVNTREPGGTFLSEKIRDILITSFTEETLTPQAELLLMYASRIQHINQFIKPNLKNGTWVISDRFNWSSFAYQGGGRNLGFDEIKKLDTLVLSDFTPDLVIYLDIDPHTGLNRIKSRQNIDRIEQENTDFFTRSREIFLKLADNNSTYSVIINGSKNKEEVRSEIFHIINKFINNLG